MHISVFQRARVRSVRHEMDSSLPPSFEQANSMPTFRAAHVTRPEQVKRWHGLAGDYQRAEEEQQMSKFMSQRSRPTAYQRHRMASLSPNKLSSRSSPRNEGHRQIPKSLCGHDRDARLAMLLVSTCNSLCAYAGQHPTKGWRTPE